MDGRTPNNLDLISLGRKATNFNNGKRSLVKL
jgi:hypothetical protein